MLGAISTILRRWKLTKQLERIYLCCIRPVITYASTVTFGKNVESKRRIERVNKVAAKLVLNNYQLDYNESLTRLGWTSIEWIVVQDMLHRMHQHIYLPKEEFLTEIRPVTARRSSRLTNSKCQEIEGVPPKLSRTKSTAVSKMVVLWNALPNSVADIPTTRAFMEALSATEIRTLMLQSA
jgi:hypothetical protein